MAQSPTVVPGAVYLPAVRVVGRQHVEASLTGVEWVDHDPDSDGGLTVWIDSATVGVSRCFSELDNSTHRHLIERMSRVLVQPDRSVGPSPVVLGALVKRIGAYEPDLVDLIHSLSVDSEGDIDAFCVGERAFANFLSLREVVLPRSITHIGNSAFYECTGLTSVTLPDSLIHIGNRAFNGCRGLTSVTLPDSLTYIGAYAFYGCRGLTSVTLPDSLTHIGNNAFWGCTELTSVMLPNSLTHVGSYAFFGCTMLTSVTLPDTLTHSGISAFCGCAGLTSVTRSMSALG